MTKQPRNRGSSAVLHKAEARHHYGSRPPHSWRELMLHQVRALLRRTNSASLGMLTRSGDLVAQIFRRKYLPLNIRAIISLTQPIDPLRNSRNLPSIELIIPFVEKDLKALPLVLANAAQNIRNPLDRITLITPREAGGTGPRFASPESPAALKKILKEFPGVQLIYDQDLLGPELLSKLDTRFGAGDRNAGWVMQQLIKLSAALRSASPGALILDADTVLLAEKTWLDSHQKQLLQVALEYHSDFMKHVESFFQVPKKYRLSFVTHHQLMQPEVVRTMFPRGQDSLIEWWESSKDPIGRDLGDYEAYGSFLAHHYPQRVAYGSFANLFSPQLEKFLHDIEGSGKTPNQLIPNYCSVSFHSWAQVPHRPTRDSDHIEGR